MNYSNALDTLQKLVQTLDRNFRKKVFLIDGTLLGFIRDGGFIAGDSDIDIGMWIEDFDARLIADMQAAGFEFTRSFGKISDGYQLRFIKGAIPVDIVFYYRHTDHIENTVYSPLGRFGAHFPKFATKAASFHGIDVMVPDPPEAYLSASYGPEWKRPVKRWNYKYCTHNMRPVGNIAWRLWYRVQRAWWNRKNPDVYQPVEGAKPRVVYADGVFDLFHANHLALLQEAKSYGEYLVVGVASDAATESYKRRPVIAQEERLRIVQNIACVDEAILLDAAFDEKTMEGIVERYNVSTVVYAGDATPEFYRGVEAAGMMVRPMYHQGVSTSGIIAEILHRNDCV